MKMSDHQLIDHRQNREQEVHLKNYHQYHHSLQVKPVVVKKTTQNHSMSQKVEEEGREIPKTRNQKQKQKPQVLDKKPSQKAKHNQLHLHMVLRKTRINHGVIGENQNQNIFC